MAFPHVKAHTPGFAVTFQSTDLVLSGAGIKGKRHEQRYEEEI